MKMKTPPSDTPAPPTNRENSIAPSKRKKVNTSFTTQAISQ